MFATAALVLMVLGVLVEAEEILTGIPFTVKGRGRKDLAIHKLCRPRDFICDPHTQCCPGLSCIKFEHIAYYCTENIQDNGSPRPLTSWSLFGALVLMTLTLQ